MLFGLFALSCTGPDDPPTSETDTDAGETDTDTAPGWPVTSWSDPVVDALRAGRPGATWSEARTDVLLLPDCDVVVAQLGHCLGINPLTPFFTYAFEQDAAIGHPVGVFQLDPHEAVVFVGKTPPEGVYLSLQYYVYARDFDGSRDLVVANIAPSVNDLTIATDGPPDDPYDRYTAVVWTPNATTGEAIRAELAGLFADNGIDPGAVQVVPVPLLSESEQQAVAADPSYEGVDVIDLRMGYAPTDDWFTVIVRMAGLPLDSPYIDPTSTPSTAFKVRLDDPPAPDSFPYPVLPPPRDPTGPPPELADALELLADQVRDDILGAGLERARLRFGTNDFRGYTCLNNGTACGSIDDALYMNSFATQMPPGSTGGVYAVGVVHPDVHAVYPDAPPLAYSSITLRNEPQRMGVSAVWHTELRGTARARYPDGVDGISDTLLDLLYVWEFARDCGDRSACTVIGDGPVEVPVGQDFNLTERAYLDQRTATGPSREAIVAPWALWYGENVQIQLLQERIRIP
jgi:hypothetical protein